MCTMRAYETEKITSSYYMMSRGGRHIPVTSTTDSLKYLFITINFLDSWLKPLEDNFV